MNKIVILTDSYKECLSGLEVANCIKEGFIQEFENSEIVTLAIADGGEGTTEALVESTNGSFSNVVVHDPLMRLIEAQIGFNSDKTVAFIEMANASGLHLVTEEEKNPLVTTSYGTGELIKYCVNSGVEQIILGIGGSATNDAGVGMLAALGVEFLDEKNNILEPIVKNIAKIEKIDTAKMIDLKQVSIKVACDVLNPFTGPKGASYIFGPQKGASESDVVFLENSLIHLNTIIKKQFNIDLSQTNSTGAAGGMGGTLLAILNADIISGIELVIDFLNIEEIIKNADLVITGEGRMDSQSIDGKGPIGIANLAAKYNVETIAICGSVSNDVEVVYDHNIKSVFSVMLRPQSLSEALADARKNLTITSRAIARLLK